MCEAVGIGTWSGHRRRRGLHAALGSVRAGLAQGIAQTAVGMRRPPGGCTYRGGQAAAAGVSGVVRCCQACMRRATHISEPARRCPAMQRCAACNACIGPSPRRRRRAMLGWRGEAGRPRDRALSGPFRCAGGGGSRHFERRALEGGGNHPTKAIEIWDGLSNSCRVGRACCRRRRRRAGHR